MACAVIHVLSLTWPCSKAWPVCSHLTNTIMCAAKVWGECVSLIVSDHMSESTFSGSNWAEGKSRHIQYCDVLTHHQFHFGFECIVP